MPNDPTNAALFPMPPITFLSFTPNGGRFGRIAWSNGNGKTWGRVHWDRWWPRNPPTLTPAKAAQAAQAAAILGHAMKTLGVSVQQATKAAAILSAAMANRDA
jgi:hypothetical protein